MKTYRIFFTLTFLSFTISACTWVELNESGQRVRLATNNEVASCQKIGNVSAKTRNAIIKGSARGAERVAKELTTLARNEAATINANTIVAASPIEKGSQTFYAYQCP